MTPISVIGLGLMGSALARTLIDNGYRHHRWPRGDVDQVRPDDQDARREVDLCGRATCSPRSTFRGSLHYAPRLHVRDDLWGAGLPEGGRSAPSIRGSDPRFAQACARLLRYIRRNCSVRELCRSAGLNGDLCSGIFARLWHQGAQRRDRRHVSHPGNVGCCAKTHIRRLWPRL